MLCHRGAQATEPQCECDLGWWGDQCDQYDVWDTIECGFGRCRVDDASIASCACDVGYDGVQCDQRSGGAVLPSIFDGVGGGQAGAAVFGVLGVIGVGTVASLVKRRVAQGGVLEAASELSAPLATAVWKNCNCSVCVVCLLGLNDDQVIFVIEFSHALRNCAPLSPLI